MAALLSTLAAFVLILVLARFKVPLALAVLCGSVAAAVMFGLGACRIATVLLEGAIQPRTIAMIVITVLLLSITEAMQAGGQMQRMVHLAGMLLRRPAVAMAALPALIGLLPMVGGALFSAPMVKSASGRTRLDGSLLSAINYWFRHIWEHWWPMYPGVVLAVTLTGSTPGRFMAFQIPLGLFMAASGLLLFRKTHPDLHQVAPRPPLSAWWHMLWSTSSIFVILIVWAVSALLLRLFFFAGLPESAPSGDEAAAGLAFVRRFVPLTVGLLASLVWTARINRLAAGRTLRILAARSTMQMALLVLSVMVFQHVLAAVEAGSGIAREMRQLHVPVVAVVIMLPFVAGMVTGLAIGFVGTSFPIVIALVAGMPHQPALVPYVALAYAWGHLGQMLSPLHLCHVVSNRYFNTTYGPVYRRILPPAACTAGLATAYFLALRAVMH